MAIQTNHEPVPPKRRGSIALRAAWALSLSMALIAALPGAERKLLVEQYVRELEASYRGVRTLKAEFTQTYLSAGKARVESGTVVFARGGKMRWDYLKPEPKLFLSDGRNLWLYVPEDRQATRSAVKSSEDVRMPFRLLLSRFDLRKIFSRIEFDDQTASLAPGEHILRAFPRPNAEDQYREVWMELNREFDIRRLVILYPDQSRMEFTFVQIERNVPLKPQMFRFTPPPGSEIIDR